MWQLNRPHPSSCMYTLISNLSKYNLPIFCSQGVEVLHVAGEQAPSIISCMLYPQGVQILHVAYHLVYYIHRVFRYYMWQLKRLHPDNQLVKALTCIGRMYSCIVECVFLCVCLCLCLCLCACTTPPRPPCSPPPLPPLPPSH